jgi:hypothetical protein
MVSSGTTGSGRAQLLITALILPFQRMQSLITFQGRQRLHALREATVQRHLLHLHFAPLENTLRPAPLRARLARLESTLRAAPLRARLAPRARLGRVATHLLPALGPARLESTLRVAPLRARLVQRVRLGPAATQLLPAPGLVLLEHSRRVEPLRAHYVQQVFFATIQSLRLLVPSGIFVHRALLRPCRARFTFPAPPVL